MNHFPFGRLACCRAATDKSAITLAETESPFLRPPLAFEPALFFGGMIRSFFAMITSHSFSESQVERTDTSNRRFYRNRTRTISTTFWATQCLAGETFRLVRWAAADRVRFAPAASVRPSTSTRPTTPRSTRSAITNSAAHRGQSSPAASCRSETASRGLRA